MADRQIGLSSFVLASPFTDDSLDLLPGVKEMGYDLLEICVEEPPRLTAARVRAAADSAGLGLSVGGAFGASRDLSHDSAHGRAAGLDYIRWCIDFAAEVGSPRLGGPMYSAVGKTRMLPAERRAQQRAWAAEGLREAGDYAAERGVVLAVEPLNRFETDLVNTVEQGLELCDLVDRDNVGLLLDTLHLNIEEKDLAAAVRRAAPRLLHFQASENDRGTPGTGHVPWQETFYALREVGYEGPVVVEAFRPDIVEIARAVSLWRPVAASMEDLARDALNFLRSELGPG